MENEDNPILWANYLIYSQYFSTYHEDVKNRIERLLSYKTDQIGTKEVVLQKEFWYVLVFINCPYISNAAKAKLTTIVQNLKKSTPTQTAEKATNVICDFLLQPTLNLFFYWGYYHFNTSKQLTFRTYQRTLFKQYKNKRSVELYGSLDT